MLDFEQEYWDTGFDLEWYENACDEFSCKHIDDKRRYLKKMKWYKLANHFHGEKFIVAFYVVSYIWNAIPIDQPYGYLNISDIASEINFSEDEVSEIIDYLKRYSVIKYDPDGICNVRYKDLLG